MVIAKELHCIPQILDQAPDILDPSIGFCCRVREKILPPFVLLTGWRLVYARKSILQESIKSLPESTWESLHRFILGYAAETKIGTGSKLRSDSTAIETNIHAVSIPRQSRGGVVY